MRTESIRLNLRQRTAYLGLRLLLLLLRALSVRQAAMFGAWLGGCAYRLMHERKRNVIHNLRIIHGGRKSYDDCELIARDVFRRTGANFVGGMRAGLLPDHQLDEVVEVRGQEHMREALAKGRGVIALLGHMGPWEVYAQLGKRLFLGAPAGSLYRPIDNPAVDMWVREERGKRGMRLFSRKEGWTGAIQLLREGGGLIILADQRAGSAGIPAPLFGRDVLTTRLPYILHRKTGAPLVAMAAWTVKPGKWVIQIQPPVFPDAESLETRETFTARCNRLLEDGFRISLEDGFWFHRRFRPEVRTFFPKASTGESGLTGRRALIVVPDDGEAAEAFGDALGRFASRRASISWVLAGEQAALVARAAGLSDVSLIEGGSEVGRTEHVRRILEVDKEGGAGIDGGLILPGSAFSYWTAVLNEVGLERVLGASGEGKCRGVRQPFVAPDRPMDPEAWLALLESVSESG